jgi:fructokinase
MAEQISIGIDLGGTKIEIAAFDAAGRQRLRRRVPTPRGDYQATLQSIADLVRAGERELGARASVGIGTPGAISRRTGCIKNANSTWLNGRPLKPDIERLLEREVRIANDANCFALSETTDGAARGAAVVFGVILGTGVGGGIVVNGEVVTGANSIAGEWGHNPLPLPQSADQPLPDCYCGRAGCIETYLSGPGLQFDHVRGGNEPAEAVDIALRAAAGEAACEATLARYEERLARSLAHVINLLDPDVIVLGGGLSNTERLYRNVPRIWERYVFSDRIATCLVPNRHGDSSGVRGAAWLWGRPANGGSANMPVG